MIYKLRFQFIIVVLGFALGPLVIITIFAGDYSFNSLKQQNIKAQQMVASQIASDVKNFVNARMTELSLLTRFIHLNGMDTKKQERYLHSLLLFQKFFEELTLIDRGGQETVRLSRSEVFLKKDLKSRATRPEYLAPFQTKTPYIGPIRYNERIHAPVMYLAIPLLDLYSNNVAYILKAEFSVKRLWNLLTYTLLDGVNVYIIDQTGKVVGHRNPMYVLQGKRVAFDRGETVTVGLSGEKVVRAGVNIELGQQTLTVVAEQPVALALAPVRKVVGVIMCIGLLACLTAFTLYCYVSRYLVSPIEVLARDAQKIGEGLYPEPVDLAGRNELGALARAFNNMVEQLRFSAAEINAHINELKKKNSLLDENTRELKVQHDRFMTVMDSLDAFVYAVDLESYEIMYVNKKLDERFGEILGHECWKCPSGKHTVPCRYCNSERLVTKDGTFGPPYIWELENLRDGRWYQCSDQAIRWPDGRIVRLEIATDISERKKVETALETSLKEKEVMLREIHHRVKNNMQVILSLLRMYQRRLGDERLKQVFEDCRGRIYAMSLIHETLYMSESLRQIDFATYLETLCRDLGQIHSKGKQQVRTVLKKSNVVLDMDKSIALGMVISELVGNAFKHAFCQGQAGDILVELQDGAEGRIDLLIADNGQGLPDGFDIGSTTTLGLQLVRAAVENDLGGEITFHQVGEPGLI